MTPADDAGPVPGPAKRPRRQRKLARQSRERDCDPAPLIAYDLETSRIEVGTPRPLYLTAYCPGVLDLSEPVRDMRHLGFLLASNFLTLEHAGARFVAWNANRFDAMFIAAALVASDDLVIRPYLTRGKTLRGMRVQLRVSPPGWKAKSPPWWEFIDGIAATGLTGTSLADFSARFAPEHAKLTGVIDFEGGQDFDPRNPEHVRYARQDSIALYWSISRAQSILVETFNEGLRATMGATCIRILQAHMPRMVEVDPLPADLSVIVREQVMRGGFCYCARRHDGPVWKYDINQAYAAAMREARLPAGRPFRTVGGVHPFARVYVARVSGTNHRNPVPFYCRQETDGRLRSVFAYESLTRVWITGIEVEQLRREGWRLTVHESWTWEDDFTLREYVDRLETLRTTCEGGPKGAIGTMVKAVGNHSYGKTVEVTDPIEYLVARDRPEGYLPVIRDDDSHMAHVWYRDLIPWDAEPREGELPGDRQAPPKPYHQPHLGAMITAHVRMVVRRAALLAPDAWLYADTDCVIYDRDVTALLDIDPARYGAWKVEETGARYLIIAKKVYAKIDADARPDDSPKTRSAKGLHPGKLTNGDFEAWAQGEAPTQDQVQANNFLRVMSGADMFRGQTRRGTAVPSIATKPEPKT